MALLQRVCHIDAISMPLLQRYFYAELRIFAIAHASHALPRHVTIDAEPPRLILLALRC